MILTAVITAVILTGCAAIEDNEVESSDSIAVETEMVVSDEIIEEETTLPIEEPAKPISTLKTVIATMPQMSNGNTPWEIPVVVEDESGNTISMPIDLNEWFENAVFVNSYTEEPGVINGIRIGDNGVEMVEGGDRVNLVFAVDGTDYIFSFGPGSQIAIEKTETGYILVPDETIKLSPSQEPGGFRTSFSKD